MKLSALSILGSSLEAAASLSPPAAEPPATVEHKDFHDPCDCTQKDAESPGAHQLESEVRRGQQESLKKFGDFARSTSQSFSDWKAKAVDKLDGAPEKLQYLKQRTRSSFDRAGERLDELVTRVDSKLDSRAQIFTDTRITRIKETSERVVGSVASAVVDASKSVSQDVRKAMEGTGGEFQATMSLVNLQGERTGDEMIDAYFAHG